MSSTLSSAGLNFEFSDEQRLLRQTIRDVVDRELPAEYCREVEQRDSFPWDLRDKLRAAGLYGIGVPEEYGGEGGTIIDQMIVAEELARTLAGLLWVWGVPSHTGAKSVGLYGTDEQKARILPDLAAGNLLFAMAITEPAGGTDVLGTMQTRATPTEGGWLVNGTKIWSTMAHVADLLLLVVRTKTDVVRPSDGITILLCDAKQPGVRATPIPKLGMRSLGSCEVQLEDVFVPHENVLGELHNGWRQLTGTLNNERIMVGALCCGVLQAILADMVRYATERTAFGKPIGQFQAIQHMIADTHIALETARLHTYRAAWLQSLGRPCGVESTMAKVVASEVAVAAADRGIQILGGYGYSMEFDMQRYWRDLRLYPIGPISNEMGRNYIGESLGLPRSF